MKKLMAAILVLGALALGGCDLLSPPEEPVDTYTLTYSANGGTGTAPVATEKEKSATITLAAGSSLSKAEFTYDGWNTAADGSGTPYAAGATLTMGSADLTLFAQWKDLIVGTWKADVDLAGGAVNMADVTTITGTTFSTTRTLTYTTAGGAALAAYGAVAGATVPRAVLEVLSAGASVLLGFPAGTDPLTGNIQSGTYTRIIGGATFALTDNTKNNSAAVVSAAATAGLSEVVGSPAIDPYTGYFTRAVTFSTLSETAGTPAAPVSSSNPKPQNWMTHFTADTNTLTMWDGGSVMPVTRVLP